MRTVRFGIIGGGLMGREFASAAARWCHLAEIDVRPEIVSVCKRTEAGIDWFTRNFPTIRQVTREYQAVLTNPEVDAVYAAVPHHLHEEIYTHTIASGRHLLGEKPFGIDLAANSTIMAMLGRNPEAFVRCVSQFPFYPAVQRIGKLIESGALGTIIEVQTGFLHSSDLDPDKPINWKRIVEFNGEYGVLGDLGMHACHVPLRAGWRPRNVRAILSDIVRERPGPDGRMVPCRTWDNATLLSEMEDPATGQHFPWTLRCHRIAPGEKNSWYVSILGTKTSVRFSTANPRRLEMLEYRGGQQAWSWFDMGMETAYKTVSGAIFEFGFADAIQQMWAAFLHELHHRRTPGLFAGCVTPDEVAISHRLFTAALESHRNDTTVRVERE
jgi:predicted dehydrogenase